MGRVSARLLGRSSRRAAVVRWSAAARSRSSHSRPRRGRAVTAERRQRLASTTSSCAAPPSPRSRRHERCPRQPGAERRRRSTRSRTPSRAIPCTSSTRCPRTGRIGSRPSQTSWRPTGRRSTRGGGARIRRARLAPTSRSSRCGLQLDLSSVKLRQSSAQLAAQEEPFDQVFDSLDSQGFTSQFTKYVVYYDGPVGDDNICGIGGTLRGGLRPRGGLRASLRRASTRRRSPRTS